MQNRYVGDIGDYVKLAILRRLSSGRRLGVAWWLYPDETHNSDGKFIEYLNRQNDWKHYDEDLYESMRTIRNDPNRSVKSIENAALLPGATYAPDVIPCIETPCAVRPSMRKAWLTRVATALDECDLIFVDPDNGIAPLSLKLTHKRAGKSVTIEELLLLSRRSNGRQRAIVVYHHQTRQGGHLEQMQSLAKRMQGADLNVSGALRANPWASRFFFILNGDSETIERAADIAEEWHSRIAWYPNSGLFLSSG